MVDFSTVRTCLALAVQRGYFIHQMDVRTAFLHGNIDDEIYVTPPKELEVGSTGSVMKLTKGLYGLKQSPRIWSEKWREIMKSLNFSILLADCCVFIRGNVWLLVYVDDILIISPHISNIRKVKYDLSIHLDVKDMGQLRSFLGISFIVQNDGAWLSQTDYVKQILTRFQMHNCKPVSTPMIENCTLSDHEDDQTETISRLEYQERVGCLLFLATRTRPDISSAVGILCRYASAPKSQHWIQLKRVFRYLRGTVNYSLWLDASEGDLIAYSDADWASNRTDRKQTSGVLIQIGKSTVSWKTLKQNSVALSSTEAEFISMSEATKEIIWLRKLTEELNGKKVEATVLYVDIQGALRWGSEGIRSAKHVAIRVNFVKQEVNKGSMKVKYYPSSMMPSDILTKPLTRVTFEKHRDAMNVNNMETARRGIGSGAVPMNDVDKIAAHVKN